MIVRVPATLDFACHSEACRPPRSGGTGGSLPGDAAAAKVSGAPAVRGLTEPDSGFTISAHTLKPFASGYAVAIAGSDKIIVAANAFDANGNPSAKLVNIVRDRITAAMGTKAPKGTKLALGGWHNPADGKIEINTTIVFPKAQRVLAEAFGRKNDQISMFSIHEGKVIDLGGTGGNRQEA